MGLVPIVSSVAAAPRRLPRIEVAWYVVYLKSALLIHGGPRTLVASAM
jgi:hypothetical protein